MSYITLGLTIIGILIFIWVLSLRRVVPPNIVHIVQRGKRTISYGIGKESNTYYEFPKWMPIIGIVVQKLPVANFDIDLPHYSAYDKDRVPFVVDIKAFFHIADTNKAAEKVSSFEELKSQLNNVVQGAVRSILAKSHLEEIMQERSHFGTKFTEAVTEDLKSWGVEPIKSIELMDVRDAKDSHVIEQIMQKKKSAIDKESRVEVAKNRKEAEQAELEARKEVALTAAETNRIAGEAQAQSHAAIGIAEAEATKRRGIAEQESLSEIANAEKSTAERRMEVIRVNEIRQAEITREAEIIKTEQEKRQTEIEAQAAKYRIETEAEADKFRIETEAQAELTQKIKQAEATKAYGQAEAEIILAKGQSIAESKKLEELASVVAQIELAEKIGNNESYQNYLVRIREVDVTGEVNKVQYQSLATALNGAELKVISNSGDVSSGVNKFSDLLSGKGAVAVNSLFETLDQTEAGKALVNVVKNIGKKD